MNPSRYIQAEHSNALADAAQNSSV